ncbi:MAG: EF-P lysine aminoacylase EpmA [Planctomycetales bacterium]
MNETCDWRPAASLETLRLRGRLLRAVRQFFDACGYWEVDTPQISHERVIDANLEPFVVSFEGDGASRAASPLFLQTSPEFAMKRLLAAGAEAIYQVGHVFRPRELGRWHNPEFTMIEWYRVGDTHLDQMQVVEDLVVAVLQGAGVLENPLPDASLRLDLASLTPFVRTTYRDAFLRHTGADLAVADSGELSEWTHRRGMIPPPGLQADDRDGWLNWLLAELVEPHLGRDRPEFVCDYPPSQAALARIRPGDPPVAERFELYCRGIELCNGYHELPNAEELAARIGAESAARSREGLPRLPLPQRLLAAMQAGLPDCSGVALGFDRLMAMAIGADTVHAVLPFSFPNC